MDKAWHDKRIKHHLSIHHTYPHWWSGIQRRGLKWFVDYIRVLRVLDWKSRPKRDKRPRGHGTTKYAINRDGDLYLVECPTCLWQHIEWWEKPYSGFRCPYCDTCWKVYLEDGLVKLRDMRALDVELPCTVVRDPSNPKVPYIGISDDAPWWWERNALYRDSHNGMDGHGHKPYLIVDNFVPQNQEVGGSNGEGIDEYRPD